MPRPSPSDADGFLPLKPVVLHILLALAEKPAHGYGVMLAVRERSGGRLKLETGPFYRHLKRLLEDGLVEECPAPHSSHGSDRRRGADYRLTPLGLAVAAAESRRLSDIVGWTRKLGLLPGRSTR